MFEEHAVLAEAQGCDFPAIVVRLFNTIGPRQTGRYGMVVPRFVQAALSGIPLPIHGSGRQTRSFCDVRDVVSALVLLIGEPDAYGEVVNVGSSMEMNIITLSKLVLQSIQSDGTAKFVNTAKVRGAEFREIRRRVPDCTKLERLIGKEWQMWPIEKTIQAVAEHILKMNCPAVTEEE